jgi:predicted MFS family arabinose efflux permease
MSADTDSALRSPPRRADVSRYIFAGLCASLVSIGLARFAYTPLLPSLIQAHWFTASAAVYLGAANLAGYLIGAVLGRPVAAWLSNQRTLRLMMVLVTAAFFACAFPLSVSWFFCWRLVSGISGGMVMVLVAATVLPHVPATRRHLASGAIFLGLGLGIAASGTLIPLLMGLGLRDTWLGLGILSLVLTAASWRGWPAAEPAIAATAATAAGDQQPATDSKHFGHAVHLLYGQYALIAWGIVPPMVFLVDFIARGLGAGAHLGSLFWVLYGIGAIMGPPLAGLLADRMGPRPALRAALLVEALAVAGLYASTNLVLIGVLTVIIGLFPPGIVPLFLARIHESLPHRVQHQNIAWSRATTVFAAFQAVAGYAYSALFNASGNAYGLLFLSAGLALGVALLVDLGAPWLLRDKAVQHGPA